LDDAGVTLLLQHIIRNTTINRLDFSHCNIGDQGALAIGKLLTVHPTLKELILCNNKIGKIHWQNLDSMQIKVSKRLK
jgi:Ran GTPase-activating protein (RanGAP) involved in mRNA processing and transport